MTAVIIRMNWKKSVQRTAHMPAATEYAAVITKQTPTAIHGENPAHDHVPPQPISGDAIQRDHARHGERRVGRERRRDHRNAGEPPRDIAPRDEVLREALAAALGEPEADERRER